MPHKIIPTLKQRQEMEEFVNKVQPGLLQDLGVKPTSELVMAALPFYGGTTPAVGTVPAQVTIAPATESTDPPPTPASTTTETEEDPVKKLSTDPNALNQLLATVDKLQKDLTKVTGERDGFVAKTQEEARKQQTREQQLESDLQSGMPSFSRWTQ